MNEGGSTSGEASAPADRHYAVEVTTETVGVARAWWRSASLAVLTVFWLNPSERPKLVTTVDVVRIIDRAVVESYSYRDPIAASPHVQSLHDRLGATSKAEFETALGIGG